MVKGGTRMETAPQGAQSGAKGRAVRDGAQRKEVR
jgi:hypothetical protein